MRVGSEPEATDRVRHGVPNYAGDDDYYERRTWRSRVQRTEDGQCVACGAFFVDGYFCYDCGIRSDYNVNVDDRQSATATSVGRSHRRRVDASARYEQLICLQTVIEAGVDSGDSITNGAATRVRRLRAANQASMLTPDEHRRINAVIGDPTLVTPWGSRRDVSLAHRRRDRKIRRSASGVIPIDNHRDVRVEWGAFCMAWDLVAWEALDAATAPDVRPAA